MQQTVTVGNVTIVYIPMSIIHHLPEYWPDPTLKGNVLSRIYTLRLQVIDKHVYSTISTQPNLDMIHGVTSTLRDPIILKIIARN